MDNATQHLTVSDLEAAKKTMCLISRNNSPYIKSPICDPEKFRSANIAATCIGIVEEMVKCVKPRREVCSPYRCSEMCDDTTFDLQDDTGWEVGQKFLDREDVDHLAALHNLWLKAVAAFGGEVK